MTARCSLDDFIRKNQYDIRVHPYSKPVKFRGVPYLVPPGILFDLKALYGLGFQLESTNVRDGADLTKSIGSASILDAEGKPTGYLIGSSGGRDAEGKWRCEYKIQDEAGAYSGIHAPDFERRHKRAQEIQEREQQLDYYIRGRNRTFSSDDSGDIHAHQELEDMEHRALNNMERRRGL